MGLNNDRSKLRLLLASSSVAALLIGGGATAVAAPCVNTIGAAFDNPSPNVVANVCVQNTSFTGNITNEGTISPSGIAFVNGTISGYIMSTGVINGGISLDGTSKISAGGTAAIRISGPSFGGGISNAGTISGAFGIVVGSTVNQFGSSNAGGGITNSGTITAAGTAIQIGATTFLGDISNSGTIKSRSSNAIIISGATFAGSVINSGSGTITGPGNGVEIFGVSSFIGDISNAGTIKSSFTNGVLVQASVFTGNIVNTGSINAARAGIYVSGVSIFSGNISNIDGGTITASVGIKVGTSNPSLAISTFNGNIVNSGTIKAPTGVLILNVSTFGGGVTNTGTISVANRGSAAINILGVSTFLGGVTNSGTIISSKSGIEIQQVATFAGNVSNSGTITAGRTGIFICNCVTFSGGSIVNTGTISAKEGIVVHNFSPISIFDSGTINGSVAAIDLTNASGGNTLTLEPGFSFPNNSKVEGFGSDTLDLGGSGSYSFDLSTIGTQITGFTTFNVVSGVWAVSNASTVAWTVMGGTLAGTGTLGGVTVNTGATLEPGIVGTPGTIMTINGSLTFNPQAIYVVNIAPSTASRANVGGTAFLNGVIEGVLVPGSYTGGATYDILAATSLSGAFSSFTAVNAPGFSGTLTEQGDPQVVLQLTAQLGSGGGLNVNQQSAATGINTYFNNSGTLPASFFPLFTLTGGNLANALTQVDGEVATGAQTGAFQSMNEFLNLLLDPSSMGGGSGGSGGGPLGFSPEQANLPPEVALAYAGLLKAPPLRKAPASTAPYWTSWGAAYGGSSTTDGNASIGSNNLTASDYGFAGGMEYHFSPDMLAGFGLAGGGTNWNLANALGNGRSDTFQAGVYGKRYFGPAYVSGALAFANNWFTTSRTAFAGDQLTANFDGQSFGARLEGGYRYAVPMSAPGVIIGVTPYAALQTQWFHTPNYSETDLTGGGFGLSYNAQTANDTRGELGGRFDDLTMLYGMPLILRGRLAWAHDWVSDPSLNASFQSLPGSTFIVYGAPIPHDSALTTAGAELHINNNWSVLGKFDGDFASGSQTYTGSGTLRYTW